MTTTPDVETLKRLLAQAKPPADLRQQIIDGPRTPALLAYLRETLPDLTAIPHLTYSMYRIFEETGERGVFEDAYFTKRGLLVRAALETLMAEDDTTRDSMRRAVHDLMWDICEETSWVLPAHEEQGPDYWDIDPPVNRTWPLGAHTMLTREPDSIDLFAAETGATLAEIIHLLGDELEPEVVQRARQEIQRRIFKPYLAYARDHWWFHGELNWNGVCNGAVGMAFVRLERDPQTLAEALALVLEGLASYIETGFEADGGSIEGVGYWNYGLMYYVALGELLREITDGAIDLLAVPKMRDIALYPVVMALTPPQFADFGDATAFIPLSTGLVQRIAERTGIEALRSLLVEVGDEFKGMNSVTHVVPLLRSLAWVPAGELPPVPHDDAFLPECRVGRLTGHTASGERIVLIASAGHNDGHHSHTDIGSFIYHVAGESLVADGGRGQYSKMYFRQTRYENIFNNSYTHNVPRIDGQLQAPGPEFGGVQQFAGTMTHDSAAGQIMMGMAGAYDIPALLDLRRVLTLDTASGAWTLSDTFAFAGEPLPVEEAFITWHPVKLEGDSVRITGEKHTLVLRPEDPAGVQITLESLAEQAAANKRPTHITRIAMTLPTGSTTFRLSATLES